jgi:hypothetical protein
MISFNLLQIMTDFKITSDVKQLQKERDEFQKNLKRPAYDTIIGLSDQEYETWMSLLRFMWTIAAADTDRYSGMVTNLRDMLQDALTELGPERFKHMLNWTHERDFKYHNPYSRKWTLLSQCAYSAWPEVVQLLLDCGSDPTVKSSMVKNGATLRCMMYGSRERSPRWLETMELLLKLGEEKSCLNQMDKEGNYSLHVAVWKKEQKAAELLIKYGADPALVNAEGEIVVKDAEGKFLLQKVTSFAAPTTSTASEAAPGAVAAVPPVPAVKKYQAYRG